MTFQRFTSPVFFAAALWVGASMAQAPASAEVAVEGAWARASVSGQKATGAFMRLTAPQSLRLVSAQSPVAGVTELHEMKMDGDVMKMRAVPVLPLPAGQTVELKPGGYHVMLMDLKMPLVQGTSVPLTLVFQDAQGTEFRQELQVPVASRAMSATPAPAHKH